jgi:hypothetical protein
VTAVLTLVWGRFALAQEPELESENGEMRFVEELHAEASSEGFDVVSDIALLEREWWDEAAARP